MNSYSFRACTITAVTAFLAVGVFLSLAPSARAATEELYSTPLFSDANLVSYYRMEGNSHDAKGSNDGTDSSVGYNSSYGEFGEGASFSGSTISLSTLTNTFNDWTVTAWVNVRGGGASSASYILACENSGNNADLDLDIRPSGEGNHLESFVYNGVTAPNVRGSYNMDDSSWHFVVAERSGSSLYLYMDNSLIGSTNVGSSALGGSACAIGSNVQPTNTYFPGYIDDLAIFSRALTSTEISNLYNGTFSAPSLASLQQYQSDATTTIAEGGTTTSSTVVFGAILNSGGTSTLQLQAEVKPTGFVFTGTPNVTSTLVASGTQATATYTGSNGSYHWQARVVDANGSSSPWQTFDPADSLSTVNFIIDQPTVNEDSAKFDGTSAWNWTVPLSSLSETGPFTIELWYKALASTTVGDLVDARSTSTGKGFVVSKNANGINFLLDCNATSSLQFTEGAHTVNHDSSTSSLPYWHHVAITQAASTSANAFNLYFDGVQQTSTNICFDPSSTRPIWFARSALSSTNFFAGDMDEVRIWDVARSAAQINASATQEISPSSTGLVAYWNFNGTSTELVSGNATSGQVNSPSLSSSSPMGEHFISLDVPSVYNGKLQWYGSTKYSSEWGNAINTWSAAGPIIFSSTTASSSALIVSDASTTDLWTGMYFSPDVPGDSSTLELNTYLLDADSASSTQNTITHELGHALGLDHSVFGNIMYYAQSTQTTLGFQDISDYNYLWGN